MRIGSFAKAAVMLGLVASALQPAHAGPMTGRVAVARIAYAEVQLGNDATGAAILEEIQGVEGEAQASIIPTAEVSPSYFLSSPAPDTTGYPRYLGCIVIKSKQGTDGKCTDFNTGNDPNNPKNLLPSCSNYPSPRPGCVRSPATLEIDPAFRDGTVTFSVGSNIAGYAITAIFGLEPQGNPIPLQAGAGTSVSPIPPSSPGPQMLSSEHVVGFFQDSKVTLGTLRSDILPDAPANITKTKRAGMLVAFNELSAGDLFHLLCIGEQTPPDTPDPLPHLWQPNHCYA